MPSPINRFLKGERQLVRINGRCLVYSTSVYYGLVNLAKTEYYPIFSTNGKLPGSGYGATFVIEYNGYISFDEKSDFQIMELASYRKFDCSAKDFSICEYPRPVMVESVYAFFSNSPNPAYSNWIVELSFDTGADVMLYYYDTPHLFPDAAKVRSFFLGEYKGINGYRAWSPLRPDSAYVPGSSI